MANYTAPGVYVEELPAAVRPIAGVGTSTAGFIGVADGVTMPVRPGTTARKPTNPPDTTADPALFVIADEGEPVPVDSWETFRTHFGDIQDGNSVLARAVFGYFDNGGGLCWVVRVKQADLTRTTTPLQAPLEKLGEIDEIALVVAPGAVVPAVQKAIVDHCEKKADRFAILDGIVATTDGVPTAAAVNDVENENGYGAVYFPWIDVGVRDAAGKAVLQPPSGHIAGVYARVDAARGVHKAPANEVIRGALAVGQKVSREAQGPLNTAGVNVIRQIGSAVTIWGARTIAPTSRPEWRYVTSRRLFNYLRESIDEGIQWAVFEPNSEVLWGMIRRNVSAFLHGVWTSGALQGDTPEKAYYVLCDERTNPPGVRDRGEVVTMVGVALVNPAEFVVVRISQWAGLES